MGRTADILRRAVIAVSLTIVTLTATAQAETIDPHRLYGQKCARCHGSDASDFARRGLRRVGGQIVGAESGSELQAFLARGHGRLSPDEVAPVAAMLRLLVETKPTA